jgi:2-oxoisovalerate ferredoxin oxidoreductase beta subunit
MQDKTVFIAPVGCSVFAYYYFDAAGISVPHGRAPAVATGIVRSNPDSYVISYQGDGDLGAIGFNNFIQAANRGENMVVCFVNNGIYGMTGGQMAPTSLPGQKTQTSPYGRQVTNEGFPLKVCEMVAALDSPIYVERVALNSTANIMKARKALQKGMRYMKEKRGFSLIEFLSACPTNMKMTSAENDEWIAKRMIPYFPLKCFKDIGSDRAPIERPRGIYEPGKVETLLFPASEPRRQVKRTRLRNELRIKCAGFGGQGILSLGMMIANMAHLHNINVTWLPSYGPEMRGGTANCSVVLSNRTIGSPIVKESDILVAMNQPSMDKFLEDLKPDGFLLYDSPYILPPSSPSSDRVFSVKAAEIAQEVGDTRCANSVILGAFAAALAGMQDTYEGTYEAAIVNKFQGNRELIDMNLLAFRRGKTEVVKE